MDPELFDDMAAVFADLADWTDAYTHLPPSVRPFVDDHPGHHTTITLVALAFGVVTDREADSSPRDGDWLDLIAERTSSASLAPGELELLTTCLAARSL